MAYDGNGNYVRVHNWVADAANSVDINAVEMDAEDNGFAAALSIAVTRDGQGKMSADFVPNADNTLNLGTGALRWATINGVPISSIVSGVYYKQTAAEATASIVPINFTYPAGYVDRYLVNTIPGTTDMSGAFTKATQVAFMSGLLGPAGCKVRWGATAPYLLNSAVNCTGIRGVIFEDESGGSVSSGFAGIIVNHTDNVGLTGHGFDLSTSTELTFNNVTAKNGTGIVPQSLFFAARNAAASSAGVHRFNNCRTISGATFNWIYYGYGSEENTWINCEFYNSQPGSGIASHNQTNPANFKSSFVTIATGSQSNTDHRWLGGNSLLNLGNSGSQNEVLIQLENANNVTFRDGLMGCAHGLCYVEVLGSTGSGNLTFDSIRGEPIGTQPQYGFYVINSAASASHVSWTFSNVTVDAVGELLHFVATNAPSIQNLAMRASTCTSGKVASVFNMSGSIIETLQDSVVTGQASGTVTGNIFIGGRNNVTLNGTFSGNLYADNNAGGFGVDGDNFTSAVAACTGALTVNAQWQVRLSPNGKQVTLTLPATVGTATAVASFTYGVVLPTQYRPSANLRCPCIIEDNGGTPNQQGFLFVNASTGGLTIFKDIVGTATFTAAAGAGIPGLTEFTWNL